ncbi:MAG TPA: hypothetical protein VGD70_29245 [Actinophytocola sp.]
MSAMSHDHAGFVGCFEVASMEERNDRRHFGTREIAEAYADARWGAERRGDEVHQLDEGCSTIGCGCQDRYVGGEAGYGIGHYRDRAEAMAAALAEGDAVETTIAPDTGDPIDQLVFSRNDDQTRRDIADGYHAGCSGTAHITGEDTAFETAAVAVRDADTAGTPAAIDRAAGAVAQCSDEAVTVYFSPREDDGRHDDQITRGDHDTSRDDATSVTVPDDTMEAF